jgi:hypothetical protein
VHGFWFELPISFQYAAQPFSSLFRRDSKLYDTKVNMDSWSSKLENSYLQWTFRVLLSPIFQ